MTFTRRGPFVVWRLDLPKLRNARQERFAQEYLRDLNAKEAGLRAGYGPKGVRQIAHKIMQLPEVEARIAELMAQRERRTQASQDKVVEELAAIAFSDMRHFAKWSKAGVELVNSESLPEGATRCVAEVSESTGRTNSIKFRLHDKVTALVKLGQHLGMFTERHEHSGPGGGPIEHRNTQVWEIGGRRIEF